MLWYLLLNARYKFKYQIKRNGAKTVGVDKKITPTCVSTDQIKVVLHLIFEFKLSPLITKYVIHEYSREGLNNALLNTNILFNLIAFLQDVPDACSQCF